MAPAGRVDVLARDVLHPQVVRMRRQIAPPSLLVGLLLACPSAEPSVPEGKLAAVGDVAFGPQDLAAVRSQLGAFGQLRFRGLEGERELLRVLVETELMAQEAIDAGLASDPRVEFSRIEEIAAIHLSSQMERRVPRESVASKPDALRAYYESHRDEFVTPERRSLQGVMFLEFPKAQEAHDKVMRGEAQLDELGSLIATPMAARDDDEFPSFHPFLFDDDVGLGDMLEHPVWIADSVVVGRVQKIEPASVEPFDDPEVQERLVAAVRAPLVAEAKRAWLAELAERYPERPQ